MAIAGGCFKAVCKAACCPACRVASALLRMETDLLEDNAWQAAEQKDAQHGCVATLKSIKL